MDMIAVTFPEVKINTKIEDLSFDTLEQMIFEISQHISCKVFEKVITDIDGHLRHKRKRGIFENTDKRKK